MEIAYEQKAMSGILRKRDRGDSLTAEEHVMMEMKENNYWAMFRDRMIVLSVLLYGMHARLNDIIDHDVVVYFSNLFLKSISQIHFSNPFLL